MRSWIWYSKRNGTAVTIIVKLSLIWIRFEVKLLYKYALWIDLETYTHCACVCVFYSFAQNTVASISWMAVSNVQ